MTITDRWLAERHLARIGYYRLKDYWHPFRKTAQVTHTDGSRYTNVLEDFRSGTEFRHAVELYIFDKKLRLLMLDAIERIEVALRVDLAHTLGHRSRHAHRDSTFLDQKRSMAPRGGQTEHQRWLARADEAEERCRADWAKDYQRRYGSPMPIWMVVETWDLGTLSRLLAMSHASDRMRITGRFGLIDPETFISWVKCLAYTRNACAHHARLWNHPLVNQPKKPKQGEAIELDHLWLYQNSRTRVYAAAAVAQHFMKRINPNSGWATRLESLWANFPAVPTIGRADGGFMPSWQTNQLWQ